MAETVAAMAWLRGRRDASLVRMSNWNSTTTRITTFIAAGILVAGCTSNATAPSGGDPDGGGSGPSACVTSELAAAGGDACGSCVASSCATTLLGFQDSCSTYFSCACPGGAFEGSRSAACQSGMSDACVASAMSMTDCETTVCSASCTMSTNPFAGADAGSDSGPSTVPFACTLGSGSAAMCSVTQVDPSTLPTQQQTCADSLGQSGTACSTTGLAGCCTYPSGTKSCYYDPSQLAGDQATCTGGSGKWSSTP
jgi:hypothetical protein